jgi:hypothetical protein
MGSRACFGAWVALAAPLLVIGGCSAILGIHEIGPPEDASADGTTRDVVTSDAAGTDSTAPEGAAPEAAVEAAADAPAEVGVDAGLDAITDASAAGDADASSCPVDECCEDGGVKDCLGGACVDGVCQPVILANHHGYPVAVAVDDASVYWIDNSPGAVWKASLDGSNPTGLASGSQFWAIAVYGGNVYYSDQVAGTVNSVPGDGGGSPQTVTNVGWANDLAVDGTGVYMADLETGNVYSIPLDGGSTVLLFDAGLAAPAALAITIDSTFVYWSMGSGDQRILKTSKQGTGSALELAGQQSAFGIAVNAAALFLVNNDAPPEIGSISLPDGGNVIPLIAAMGTGERIAIDQSFAYWTDDNGNVTKVPLDGGNATAIATGQLSPMGIAVDDKAVYWTNNAASGQIMRVAK